MKALKKWDPKDCYNWKIKICSQFEDPDYLISLIGPAQVDIQQVLQMRTLSPVDKVWVFIHSPYVPDDLRQRAMVKVRAAFPAVGDPSVPKLLQSYIVDLQNYLDQKSYWKAEGCCLVLAEQLNKLQRFEESRRQVQIMQAEIATWLTEP